MIWLIVIDCVGESLDVLSKVVSSILSAVCKLRGDFKSGNCECLDE